MYYYGHQNNSFWPAETTVYIPNHVILYQKKFQGFFGRFSEKKLNVYKPMLEKATNFNAKDLTPGIFTTYSPYILEI